MAVTEIQNRSNNIQKPILAASLVILIWLGYAVMQTYSVLGGISQGLYAILGFVPGIAGIWILIKSGIPRENCYLQNKRLSWGALLYWRRSLSLHLQLFCLSGNGVDGIGRLPCYTRQRVGYLRNCSSILDFFRQWGCCSSGELVQL